MKKQLPTYGLRYPRGNRWVSGDSVIRCAAAGVRRSQKRPGRPAGKAEQPINDGSQTDFGF